MNEFGAGTIINFAEQEGGGGGCVFEGGKSAEGAIASRRSAGEHSRTVAALTSWCTPAQLCARDRTQFQI